MDARIKFNTNFTPAQERSIRLALERGLLSDKEQARAEGLSPRSITDRWAGIASAVGLGYGKRDRAQVITALFVRRHVEIAAALLVAVLVGTGATGKFDMVRPVRINRPVKTATVRRDQGNHALAGIHFLAYRSA